MYYLITRIKFILSSVSIGWLFWSVNHTSIAWNFKLNIFKKIKLVEEISCNWPNCLCGTNACNGKNMEKCLKVFEF